MSTVEISNRKAYYEYFVLETLECGIALKGNEVKSIREGMCSLKEAWCCIQDDELVVRGMHIGKWHTSNMFDIDEDRERKLLVHKKEILKLKEKLKENGITLIPLKVYFSNNKCKVFMGICKGKHNYDKRETMKERQVKRDIDRALKG